ncbi:hypothetical protein PASE110613_07385 [Paenibacillus sediminis]|uniref:Uncharacterized protein n=1 Tax=Paenibacillus sediminis TaxID=664909 RepID=A0ABS4H2T3_9BACL|nr:hypothetical protein [Paenibacillus sediminis]MBP1936839.1 hypothetical protein [Paenibacillus sediminis]
MAIKATDGNGKFTADYAAYTKLVIANRVQSQVTGNGYDNKESMSFEQFMDAIHKDQAVNHNYTRPVSAEEVRNNQIYEQHNGTDCFARQRFLTISRAYELGLVDSNGILISSVEMK